ncbi:MAG: DNA cytosine methyltransferase [Verrucomicrobia bacterium]|nr:MAG: DNA cytosine methyltransferase [Verrucomicrobiota bacterium]
MNALSLCAGVGGLDLGLKLADPRIRTVGYVEREAFAAATLVARMEDQALDRAPIWDDPSTLDGRGLRRKVDLVTGGYPCQPFSTAGKRLGAEDERHLWPQFARIIREVRPRLVFLENVAGHVRLGLDAVLADLAELGFDAEWDVFSSAGVGAPHRRRRLFVLAWRVSDSERDTIRVESERGSDSAQAAYQRDAEPGELGGDMEHAEGLGGGQGNGSEEAGRRVAQATGRDMADPDSGRLEGEQEQDIRPQGGLESPRRGDLDGCDWRTLYPPGPAGDWSNVPPEAQPCIRRESDGVASRVDRLRAIGNGVDPLVAAHAWRTLANRAGLT